MFLKGLTNKNKHTFVSKKIFLWMALVSTKLFLKTVASNSWKRKDVMNIFWYFSDVKKGNISVTEDG